MSAGSDCHKLSSHRDMFVLHAMFSAIMSASCMIQSSHPHQAIQAACATLRRLSRVSPQFLLDRSLISLSATANHQGRQQWNMSNLFQTLGLGGDRLELCFAGI